MYLLVVPTLLVLHLCAFIHETEGAPVEIGQLPNLQHGIGGTLFALDETTFFIQDFAYDGQGPDTFVYVFRRGITASASGGGIIIDWPESSSNDGRITARYTGSSNITISLQNQAGGNTGLTVNDTGTFTIWCRLASVFFTTIAIPQGLMLDSGGLVSFDYCAQLAENFQVSWTVNDTTNNTVFELCGCINPDQYMAFGISGSNTRTDMIGADVVVVWVSSGIAYAVDYLLTARQQCRNGSGVCPDTMVAGGMGTNDVFGVTGQVSNGLTCVQYSRMLNTSDSTHDLRIRTDQSQFIAWAIGPRATEEGLGDLAFFHTEYPRNVNVEINFGAAPTGSMQCQAPPQCMQQDLCGWSGVTITSREETTFEVKIGPSGGLRGYEHITGLSGWGIAFYIDGNLAPVLKLSRNVTYTFIVEAGNDPDDGPNYHPFYITNSQKGGIMLNQEMENNEVVYAGYIVDSNTPTAAGRHCQYVETASSANVATECSSTLQDYQNSLRVSCQGSASEAANLTWTPNENTPDTVYYQCANHLHLGWKIELDAAPTGDSSHGVDTTSPIKFFTMLFIVITVISYLL